MWWWWLNAVRGMVWTGEVARHYCPSLPDSCDLTPRRAHRIHPCPIPHPAHSCSIPGSANPRGYSLPPTASAKDDMPRGAMRILNAGKVQAAFRAAGRTTSEDTGERKAGPSASSKPSAKASTSTSSSDAKGKKRANETDEEQPAKKAKGDKLPMISPHESLGEYNRRIEALLRPGVSGAIKKAEAARGAQAKRAEEEKKARIAKAQGKVVDEVDEEGGAGKKGKGKGKEEDDEEVKFNKPAKSFAEVERRRLNDIAMAPPSLPKLRLATKNERKAGKTPGASKEGRDPLNAGQRRIMEAERERVVAMYRELKAKKEAERAK